MWRKREPKHLFPLGQVVATPAALALLAEHDLTALDFLERHVTGDWGCCVEEDSAANTEAVTAGDRIHSVYSVGNIGDRIWIITEWDRSVTTVLTPDDY